MATFDEEAWVALKDCIKAVWPEIVEGRIERSQSINRVNWQELINRAALESPYVIIHLGAAVPQDWGMDNQYFRHQVEIYYIADTDDPFAARGTNPETYDITAYTLKKVGKLRNFLIKYEGDGFALLDEHPVIDVSDENPANKVFYTLQAKKFGAMIAFAMLVGSQAPNNYV